MADGHTHSWQESDHWWGMIGWGCGDGSRLNVCLGSYVCVFLCVGRINEPMWGLNTGGLTTAERSQGGVDPHCTLLHTRKHPVQLLKYTHIRSHTYTGPLFLMQLAS